VQGKKIGGRKEREQGVGGRLKGLGCRVKGVGEKSSVKDQSTRARMIEKIKELVREKAYRFIAVQDK
jgi:hypothetical protein